MAKGGFPRNMGGMGNMNSMIKQAQKMQEEMLKAQESLGEQIIETSVGGGAVSVKVNGKKEIMEIKLSPEEPAEQRLSSISQRRQRTLMKRQIA